MYNLKMAKQIEKIFVALNKPQGYVCARKDNKEPTIMSLLSEEFSNLHIVGRLDKDTTGLIILTNDGQFTHDVTHPKKHIAKEYEVTLKDEITDEGIKKLQEGVRIDYGKTPVKPAIVKKLAANIISLTIFEGKYHQVKKMMMAINNSVVALHRIAFGGAKLNDLSIQSGEYKIIKKEDIIN